MSDEENPSDTIADTTIEENISIPAPAIPLRENDGAPSLNESFGRGTNSNANVQSEALPAPTPTPTPALAQPHNPVPQPPSAQPQPQPLPSGVPTEQTPLMMIPPHVPSQIPQTVPRQVRISKFREKRISIWHHEFMYGSRLFSSLFLLSLIVWNLFDC